MKMAHSDHLNDMPYKDNHKNGDMEFLEASKAQRKTPTLGIQATSATSHNLAPVI